MSRRSKRSEIQSLSRTDRQMLVFIVIGSLLLWGARELMHLSKSDRRFMQQSPLQQSPMQQSPQMQTTSQVGETSGEREGFETARSESFEGIDQVIAQTVGPMNSRLIQDTALAESLEPPVTASRAAMRKLKELRQCEINMSQARVVFAVNCPQPSRQDDPRAEYDALVAGMVEALHQLRDETSAGTARGETPEIDPLAVGQAFVRHPNDDVRVAALRLLGDQPPTKKSVASAQHVVRVSNSGEAVMVALDLLKRGQELAPREITTTLLAALETGGFQVRDTVARELLPFLNSDNLASFQRVLGQAPPRSRVAQFLKQNIEERQRDSAL